MNFIPRSSWTAITPRSGVMADTFIGMPFFEKPPTKITFHPVGKNLLYVQRDPKLELELLLKEATHGTGRSDIDFNYAIAQNVEGAFVLRGGGTKCIDSSSLKVLMLIGENEQPTDLLKKNQKLLQKGSLTNKPPTANLVPGDASVHVFDLIEFLIERNLYQARNDGIYGPFCEQAVHQLQLEVGAPDFDGLYRTTTYTRINRASLVSN